MFLKHFLTLQSSENSESGIDSISQRGLEIPKYGSTLAPFYQNFWTFYWYIVSKQIKLLHNKLEVEEHDCDIFETFWSLLGALRSHWSRKRKASRILKYSAKVSQENYEDSKLHQNWKIFQNKESSKIYTVRDLKTDQGQHDPRSTWRHGTRL